MQNIARYNTEDAPCRVERWKEEMRGRERKKHRHRID